MSPIKYAHGSSLSQKWRWLFFVCRISVTVGGSCKRLPCKSVSLVTELTAVGFLHAVRVHVTDGSFDYAVGIVGIIPNVTYLGALWNCARAQTHGTIFVIMHRRWINESPTATRLMLVFSFCCCWSNVDEQHQDSRNLMFERLRG